jgi:hypothetical protein
VLMWSLGDREDGGLTFQLHRCRLSLASPLGRRRGVRDRVGNRGGHC